MDYKEYLNSQKWSNIRQRILKRDINCQDCNIHDAVEVHHLNYDNIFNENDSDLIGLCCVCHGKRHDLEIQHNFDPSFNLQFPNGKVIYNSYEEMIDQEIARIMENEE